jgi:Lrp/AsnC family leucine-responsive transcriptional regulator
VRLLAHNGRMSHEQLAREVHLSRPAVHERVKRLEERQIIRGYRAWVDWAALGLDLTAFIWLRTAGERTHVVGTQILRLTNPTALVEECHVVTGEWCMMVKARAASPAALQDLIEHMRAIPHVRSTMTTLALSTLGEAELPGIPTDCERK